MWTFLTWYLEWTRFQFQNFTINKHSHLIKPISTQPSSQFPTLRPYPPSLPTPDLNSLPYAHIPHPSPTLISTPYPMPVSPISTQPSSQLPTLRPYPPSLPTPHIRPTQPYPPPECISRPGLYWVFLTWGFIMSVLYHSCSMVHLLNEDLAATFADRATVVLETAKLVLYLSVYLFQQAILHFIRF